MWAGGSEDGGKSEMIEGLSHITFVVRDLDRTEILLTTIFDARKVYESGSKRFSLARERFFLIGEGKAAVWIAIMEGDPLPSQSYNHIAFKIDDADYDSCLEKIRSLGLRLRQGRPRVEGEGRSIYFYDDDNHLFELHTGTLQERLDRYSLFAGS